MRTKVSFAAGQEEDLQGALLFFNQLGTLDLGLVAVWRGVLDLELAVALDRDPVVEGGPGSEGIDAEAGVGVIDLEETDGGAGPILDGDVDVRGAAGGEPEDEGKCEKRENFH